MDRVYWYEPNHANIRKVRAAVEAEIEQIKGNLQRSDYILLAANPQQAVINMTEKYAKEYPTETKIYARVLEIEYQQEQVAAASSHRTRMHRTFFGVDYTSRGDVHIERVKPEWKILVRREDNGQVIEKKPSDITYCEHEDD